MTLSPSSSQSARPTESLRGLHGVFVNVLEIDSEVQKLGLTTEHVRAAVLEQLQKAGIPIQPTPVPADGAPNLTIIIDTIKHPQGVFVFSVGVSLVQTAQLTRLPKGLQQPAQTWAAIAIGLTTPQRLDIIFQPLREKLAEFIEAYKQVNPG